MDKNSKDSGGLPFHTVLGNLSGNSLTQLGEKISEIRELLCHNGLYDMATGKINEVKVLASTIEGGEDMALEMLCSLSNTLVESGEVYGAFRLLHEHAVSIKASNREPLWYAANNLIMQIAENILEDRDFNINKIAVSSIERGKPDQDGHMIHAMRVIQRQIEQEMLPVLKARQVAVQNGMEMDDGLFDQKL